MFMMEDPVSYAVVAMQCCRIHNTYIHIYTFTCIYICSYPSLIWGFPYLPSPMFGSRLQHQSESDTDKKVFSPQPASMLKALIRQ